MKKGLQNISLIFLYCIYSILNIYTLGSTAIPPWTRPISSDSLWIILQYNSKSHAWCFPVCFYCLSVSKWRFPNLILCHWFYPTKIEMCFCICVCLCTQDGPKLIWRKFKPPKSKLLHKFPKLFNGSDSIRCKNLVSAFLVHCLFYWTPWCTKLKLSHIRTKY